MGRGPRMVWVFPLPACLSVATTQTLHLEADTGGSLESQKRTRSAG